MTDSFLSPHPNRGIAETAKANELLLVGLCNSCFLDTAAWWASMRIGTPDSGKDGRSTFAGANVLIM
jgi:hypothetical protein